jgi:uncharacterized membrane protein
MSTKWTKKFAVDLLERVLTTALYGVVTMLTADQSGVVSGNAQQWWLVVGLPTVLSLIKGVLANLAAPETGASLIPESPPGPKVNPEQGATDILYAAGVALLLLALVLLVTTLLKAFVVGWVVIIILAVTGAFLLFWRGGGVHL